MGTALIAGASGLVGTSLLQQLLQSHHYERVIALVRRPMALDHPKLEQVVVDFAALERVGAQLPADDAFCCLGTTIKEAGSRNGFRAVDHTAVLAFAWAAQRQGARRFFMVSAMGADATSRVFYNRTKGEVEEALAVLGFELLAVFRPSLLLGERVRTRWGERFGAAVLWVAEPLMLGSLRKYRAIQGEVVARAMLRAAFSPPQRGLRILNSREIQELGGFAS